MDVLLGLTPLNSDEFNAVVVLCQKLTDFEVGTKGPNQGADEYMDK